MGFLDGLMGHASEIDVAKANKEFERILAHGERIEAAYQLIRDSFLFTNNRLILVDRQGMTGRKMEYHSIPYKSIRHFSVETAGHFDLDAELRIWVADMGTPFQKTFNKKLDIYAVQAVLANYVAK